MDLACRGHEVHVLDNYMRRTIAQSTCSEPLMTNPNLNERSRIFYERTKIQINVTIADCSDYRVLSQIVASFQPEAVVHYAEQPSAPYSMMGYEEAKTTLDNNLGVTFSLIWSVLEHAPNCHIVKLGTMGEYGTPDIDIEEGWLDVEHNGRRQKFLYPRQAGSLYHTTKVLDTDLLWFYVRSYGLRVTDLMQGPVYGISTAQSELDKRLLPNFHYDDIFGTVLNRFLVQVVAGLPMTVYGKGGQTRGYLNLRDTLQCINLALESPVDAGELRILNQFTELFSVNDLAEKISEVAIKMKLKPKIEHLDNPRKELEDHYYNVKHRGLLDLGLKPNLLTEEEIESMLNEVMSWKAQIDESKILPRVRWT